MFHNKIRAWHKDEKKMYKVAVLYFELDCARLYTFVSENETIKEITSPLDRLILMQQSGREDDNGFNTFEGDILEQDGHKYVLTLGWHKDDDAGERSNCRYGCFGQ